MTNKDEFINHVYITLSDILKLLQYESENTPPSIDSADVHTNKYPQQSLRLPLPSTWSASEHATADIQHKVVSLLDEIKQNFPEVIQSEEQGEYHNDDNNNTNSNNNNNYDDNTYNTDTNNTKGNSVGSKKSGGFPKFMKYWGRPQASPRSNKKEQHQHLPKQYFTLQTKTKKKAKAYALVDEDSSNNLFRGVIRSMKKNGSAELHNIDTTHEANITLPATPTELNQRNINKIYKIFGDLPHNSNTNTDNDNDDDSDGSAEPTVANIRRSQSEDVMAQQYNNHNNNNY